MNKIKQRFVGAALAVIVGASALPFEAMAASSNSISKIATVKQDKVIEGVSIKIKPTSEVESGESIILTLDNAEFDEDKILEETGKTLEELEVYSDASKPFIFKKTNDTEAQVYLSAITTQEADSDTAPYYLIPIVAVATSDEDVKVTIDSNETVISSTTHTIAKVASKTGDTKTTVNKVKTFSETLYVDTITVKEQAYDTFEQGEVKVRVNSGFKFVDTENIKVTAGTNLSDKEEDIEIKADKGDSYFTFKIPESWTNTKKASSFFINGIKVEPEDEDKNYGDVKLIISGSSANITKETITVGKREDYGFEFEVIDEIPTIISGRTYYENKDLDEDDFKSATVKFAELTADTWITNRKLEFTVPEGVKIVDAEFDEVEEIKALEDSVVIADDGKTLRINRGIELNENRKDDDVASFEMNLYFSIDADFTGDIDLEVAGAGIAENELPAVTVAEAIAPISVETETTVANLGYQSFNTADIVITEAIEEALLEDGEVVITFDDKKFGGSELGFNDTNIEYTVEGELEIKDFEVTSGAITFKVDKASYNEPSSIVISNITVGTTRSVPYGSFDLKLSGNALINNYDKNIDDVYPVKLEEVTEEDNDDIYFFDTTDGYNYKDYIKIITFVGSYDSTVEVTIDSQAIKVNGEEYDVDVAPYIQAETGSTLVPLRVIAVALFGGNVENADGSSNITFDAESKTATILYNDRVIQFQSGSSYVLVDGTKVPCDNGAKAEIKGNRIFVPFRTLASVLNVPVSWDAETRTARYN